MRKLWDILISLNTVFALFALTIALCMLGSVMLPTHLEFFSGIDDSPLFQWLAEAGAPGLTWWVYALIASVALLALSTVACTVDALAGKTARGLLHKLSPQVMHLGVLMVMLAHLLTAIFGMRADVQVAKGARADIAPGLQVFLSEVSAEVNEAGTATRWLAELELYRDGILISQRRLVPAQPVFVDGLGLFFGTINEGDDEKLPSATIRVTRDPGAMWALVGGLLVTLGGIGFVISRKPQGTS